jgi:hypothetical protein
MNIKQKFTDSFIRTQLLNSTKRMIPKNARLFYWNCIQSTGYSDQNRDSIPEDSQDSDSDDSDEYKYFEKPKSISIERCSVCQTELTPGKDCMYCSMYNTPVGYQESQQMSPSSIFGFNRTFIGPMSDSTTNSGNRLSEIQKWVTISPEESELKVISDQIDYAINALGLSDQDKIRKTAINMYWNIMKYYSSGNILLLPINKGNLKKGYIAMVVWYSLEYYGKNVSRDRLIRVIPDSRLSFLPDAEKNILIIFKNAPGYEFLFNPREYSNLCNFVGILPDNIVNKINQVKTDMINANIFERVPSKIQIAACIYYVSSILYGKGGILQKRLEIIIPQSGLKSKITIQLLSDNCGPFAAATLAKITDNIVNFYGKNSILRNNLISY